MSTPLIPPQKKEEYCTSIGSDYIWVMKIDHIKSSCLSCRGRESTPRHLRLPVCLWGPGIIVEGERTVYEMREPQAAPLASTAAVIISKVGEYSNGISIFAPVTTFQCYLSLENRKAQHDGVQPRSSYSVHCKVRERVLRSEAKPFPICLA
jgi:hypothetical protein